jgi:hypothetical protein
MGVALHHRTQGVQPHGLGHQLRHARCGAAPPLVFAARCRQRLRK